MRPEDLGLSEEDAALLRDAGTALTRKGFLWRHDPDWGQRKLFEVCLRHEATLAMVLSFAGYTLRLEQTVQVLRAFREDAGEVVRLEVPESRVLALLVAMRFQEIERGKDGNRARIVPVVRFGEIGTAYAGLVGGNARNKTKMKDVLRKFVRFGLVATADGHALEGKVNEEIQLLPVLETVMDWDRLGEWLGTKSDDDDAEGWKDVVVTDLESAAAGLDADELPDAEKIEGDVTVWGEDA